jgi:hypothetical protein
MITARHDLVDTYTRSARANKELGLADESPDNSNLLRAIEDLSKVLEAKPYDGLFPPSEPKFILCWFSGNGSNVAARQARGWDQRL